MGIQSIIGNITSGIGNAVQSGLSSALAAISGLGSSIGTFTANIWSGGFAGVSDFNQLYTALGKYSGDVKAAVGEYNPNADLDIALKGQTADAVRQFVAETQNLLNAYADYIDTIWSKELKEVYDNYQKGDQSLNSNMVENDVAAVKQATQKVESGDLDLG